MRQTTHKESESKGLQVQVETNENTKSNLNHLNQREVGAANKGDNGEEKQDNKIY